MNVQTSEKERDEETRRGIEEKIECVVISAVDNGTSIASRSINPLDQMLSHSVAQSLSFSHSLRV